MTIYYDILMDATSTRAYIFCTNKTYSRSEYWTWSSPIDVGFASHEEATTFMYLVFPHCTLIEMVKT